MPTGALYFNPATKAAFAQPVAETDSKRGIKATDNPRSTENNVGLSAQKKNAQNNDRVAPELLPGDSQ